MCIEVSNAMRLQEYKERKVYNYLWPQETFTKDNLLAKDILWAVKSYRCLNFLNKIEFDFQSNSSTKEPSQFKEIMAYWARKILRKSRYCQYLNVTYDWSRGIISAHKKWTLNEKLHTKKTNYKIGKVLKSLTKSKTSTVKDLATTYLHEFETRIYPSKFRIVIDSSLKGIARMSWNQNWKSCVAPNKAFSTSLLKDIKIGIAVAYFYKEDNMYRPVGRIVLRPAIHNTYPVIAVAGKTYGININPNDFAEQLQRIINIPCMCNSYDEFDFMSKEHIYDEVKMNCNARFNYLTEEVKIKAELDGHILKRHFRQLLQGRKHEKYYH